MPNQMLKGTVKYCLGNKLFFTFVFVQFLLFECITNTVGGLLKSTSLIVLLAVLGYGLKVAQDVMNGGSSFPKINLNEFINFGLKGNRDLYILSDNSGIYFRFAFNCVKFPRV